MASDLRFAAEREGHVGFVVGTVHIVESDAPVRMVVLMGEHDLSTEAEVHRALQDVCEPGGRVIVDLSEVEFIDSIVVGVLLGWQLAQERTGGALEMVGDAEHPVVRALARMTNMQLHPSRRQAIQAATTQAAGS